MHLEKMDNRNKLTHIYISRERDAGTRIYRQIYAPRAKFKSATALPANWYIAHASVVVLYIVSPVDSWITTYDLMRVYFVKVSLFILHCICHCKNTIYYIISVVIMNRPFISFAKYISALFSSQSLSSLNKKCDIYLYSDQTRWRRGKKW